MLEGAKKYEVEWATKAGLEAIERLMEYEPLRVYAIACRYGFHDVARKAAKSCLRVSPMTIFDSDAEELDRLWEGWLYADSGALAKPHMRPRSVD